MCRRLRCDARRFRGGRHSRFCGSTHKDLPFQLLTVMHKADGLGFAVIFRRLGEAKFTRSFIDDWITPNGTRLVADSHANTPDARGTPVRARPRTG